MKYVFPYPAIGEANKMEYFKFILPTFKKLSLRNLRTEIILYFRRKKLTPCTINISRANPVQ